MQLGVQYLLDSYDGTREVWPIVPPEVEGAPHAWWWSYEDSAKNFGNFLVNPRAGIVGHLQHFCNLVRPDFLNMVKTAVLEQLDTFSDRIALHDFECYVGLAEADNLAKDEKQEIVDQLARLLPNSLDLERSKWRAGEVFKPLVAAPMPDSAFRAEIDDALVQENLDIEIESQLEDGSWPLGWDWSPIDQEAWNTAERDWKGNIIVSKLRTFRAYGRWKVSN